MKNFKKLTASVVSLMMVCTSMGGFTLWSSADDENVRLDLTSVKSLSLSTNNKKELTYTLNGETKVYSGQIILEGTSENGFTVESGTHAIVLNGVTINDSVVINPNAIVNIDVEGTNTVTAKVKESFWDNTGKAGINVPEGATLNLSGKGTLTATGSDDKGSIPRDGGAGIGGNDEENAGTITINGNVTVNAKGGACAAGIGGGDYGNGGNIYIKNGNVNAEGGDDAAGIGSGFYTHIGIITIEGGTVTATGGSRGSGIGSGYYGKPSNDTKGIITIIGGTVIATGGCGAAGIGGGADGESGNIKISKGTIIARAGAGGAGIGGGYKGDNETIDIEGGTITATGGEDAAGIGSGDDAPRIGNITITGGKVNATGGKGGAGIGGAHLRTFNILNGEITIKGGTITATGGDDAAGIGGGEGEDSATIKITNAVVIAKGGKKGAGIGGGNGFLDMDGECETITIDNSVVLAIAGEDAEPIGGGYTEFNSGTVTINGTDLNKETRKKNKERGYVQYNEDGKTTEYPDGKIPNKPLYGLKTNPDLEKTNSNTTFDIQIYPPKNLDTNN